MAETQSFFSDDAPFANLYVLPGDYIRDPLFIPEWPGGIEETGTGSQPTQEGGGEKPAEAQAKAAGQGGK